LFSQPDFHAKFQFIIDDAPLKQNKYCAGTRIPVHDITRLKDRTHPTVVVVFAWNFFDEIYKRIKVVRNNPNDIFIKYFPEISIINK
jgi:hypothetical protein